MAVRVFPETNPKGSNYGGSATIDTIAFYAFLGGGVYLADTFALQGTFGATGFKVAAQLYKAMHGGSLKGLAIPKNVLAEDPTIAAEIGMATGPGTTTTNGSGSHTTTGGGTTGGSGTGGGGSAPDPSQWIAAQGPGTDGWYWDMRGEPGFMFHFGTDITDDANWWPNNGAPGALTEFHAQTGR